MRINADLLRLRAKEIRDALDVLDRYRQLSLEEFLSRTETVDAAKYRLLIAIEAAVSMCNHLATRLAVRTPESYADCFSVLAEAAGAEDGAAGTLPVTFSTSWMA